MDLLELTHETTRGYIGDTFQIRFPDGTLDLKLVRVEVIMEKEKNKRMKRDAFALYFHGPLDPPLRQSMYPMYHEKLGGPLSIFIVPISREEGGYTYEAVFS